MMPTHAPGESGRFRVAWDQVVPSIYPVHREVSAAYTALPEDTVIEGDATSAGFTVTLPALDDAYRDVLVAKIDASGNAVTVDGDGAETINGATTLALSSQYDRALLRPGPTGWWAVQ